MGRHRLRPGGKHRLVTHTPNLGLKVASGVVLTLASAGLGGLVWAVDASQSDFTTAALALPAVESHSAEWSRVQSTVEASPKVVPPPTRTATATRQTQPMGPSQSAKREAISKEDPPTAADLDKFIASEFDLKAVKKGLVTTFSGDRADTTRLITCLRQREDDWATGGWQRTQIGDTATVRVRHSPDVTPKRLSC